MTQTEVDEKALEAAARAECDRMGYDPDQDAADAISVWMVVAKNLEPAIRAYLTHASQWRGIESAPKDGKTVYLKLDFENGVPAYWCGDIRTWVLARPLHMEVIHAPKHWRPTPVSG